MALSRSHFQVEENIRYFSIVIDCQTQYPRNNMTNVKPLAFCFLMASLCMAQDGPQELLEPPPVEESITEEVKPSVYEINLGIDVKELEKTPKFQKLLKETFINNDADKQALVDLICQETLRKIKKGLIHCGAIWWTPEDNKNNLRLSVSEDYLEEIQKDLPSNSWSVPTITFVKDAAPPMAFVSMRSRLIGMTYKDAVKVILEENKTKEKEEFIMCYLKSVDGFENPNPYKDDSDYPLMVFEVRGGRVVDAKLKIKKEE